MPRVAQETNPSVQPAATETKPAERKTFTNWQAFVKANVVPVEIVCQDYQPVHPADLSCHSRLRPDAETIIRHMDSEHGNGGFRFILRRTDGKPWRGWSDLEAAGVECNDFRCDVCDSEVPFHPQHILKHMAPHSGKTRRIVPGGTFNLTLSFTRPVQDDEFERLD